MQSNYSKTIPRQTDDYTGQDCHDLVTTGATCMTSWKAIVIGMGCVLPAKTIPLPVYQAAVATSSTADSVSSRPH